MIVRNLLFYLGLAPVTIVFTILGLLSFPLPYSVRYYIITRWSHFFIWWAKITCGLKYEIEGRENIPSTTTIVLSNHQSMWETIFTQVIFPHQTWILKKELLKIPVFGWGLALLEPIAIDRSTNSSLKQLLIEGAKQLSQNRWVILYPEGTRVKPGEERRFSRSGIALAKATGVPLLLMAHNAGLFWPRGWMIKKTGTIKVQIGPLLSNLEQADLENQAETWLRENSHKLAHS